MFRFGIMGAGDISKKFRNAVSLLDNAEVTAIASRSLERAKQFAAEQNIEHAFGSYEEMILSGTIDCVYIGATTDLHFELTMLCLKHKMPVICEKAQFENAAQAREAIAYAKEQQTFMMEAMWSRFLPAIRKAKEWLDEGKVGTPTYIDLTIGFLPKEDPKNRFYDPKLGGGAAYDLGVYGFEMTSMMMDDKLPIKQNIAATWSATGVDVTDHMTLTYPETIVSFTSSFIAALDEKLVIYGRKGRIEVPHSHYGDETLFFDTSRQLVERFHDDQTKNGFVYEAEEAMNCVLAGKLESDVVPHSLTLRCAEWFDIMNADKPQK